MRMITGYTKLIVWKLTLKSIAEGMNDAKPPRIITGVYPCYLALPALASCHNEAVKKKSIIVE
tara:strand:- start:868 stop:1056 length:189 start_codon:yes stop_codon:yes gene_type:complete